MLLLFCCLPSCEFASRLVNKTFLFYFLNTFYIKYAIYGFYLRYGFGTSQKMQCCREYLQYHKIRCGNTAKKSLWLIVVYVANVLVFFVVAHCFGRRLVCDIFLVASFCFCVNCVCFDKILPCTLHKTYLVIWKLKSNKITMEMELTWIGVN